MLVPGARRAPVIIDWSGEEAAAGEEVAPLVTLTVPVPSPGRMGSRRPRFRRNARGARIGAGAGEGVYRRLSGYSSAA